MSLDLAQPLALYLLVLSALGTVASAGYFESSTMLVVMAAVVASWFVPLAIRRKLNTSKLLGFALVVLFGAVGYDIALRGADIVGGATSFLVVVLVSRLYTERTTHEARQILLMSLLVVLAGSALSISFGFAPYFIAFIVCSVWALTTTQLSKEVEIRRSAGQQDPGANVKVSGRYLLTTSVLSVLIFLQTSAFFLAFPRFGIGYFRLAQRQGKQSIGYNDKVELGSAGQIDENSAVALRLEFPDSKVNAALLYFRGATLSEFDGHRWSRLSNGMQQLRTSADGYIHMRGVPDPKAVSYRLFQEPSEVDSIILPEPTTSFMLRREPGTQPGMSMRLVTSQGLDVIASRPPTQAIKVEGWLSVDTGILPIREPLPVERFVPETIDPRVKTLADDLAGDRTATAEVAAVFMNYLRQNQTYSTSLSAPSVGVDPVTYFLFTSKAGHCEYFASALAVMLRTRGIPARLVSGYFGAAFNRYGNYWFVSENRAHSWVEYFNPKAGWVRIDPTPPSGQPPVRTQTTAFAEMLDVMRYRWNRYIIEFNLDTQIAAVRGVQQFMQENKSDWKEKPRAVGDFLLQHRMPFLVAALFALSGWLYWLRRSIVRRKITAPTRMYRKFARIVVGRDKVQSMLGPSEVARYGKELHPKAAPAIDRFTQAYLDARFGGELARTVEMREALREVKRAVRTA